MQNVSDAMYEQIRSRITQSPVVGADETGASKPEKLEFFEVP